MKMHCVEIKFNLVCFINSAKTLYIYHNTELTLHYGICLQRVSLHTYIERNIFLFVQVHQDTEWIKIFARYSIPTIQRYNLRLQWSIQCIHPHQQQWCRRDRRVRCFRGRVIKEDVCALCGVPQL